MTMIYRLLLSCALVTLAANFSTAQSLPPSLQLLHTFDVHGYSLEIIQYAPHQRLLLAINPLWKTLDAFDLTSLDPPQITPIPDRDDQIPGHQGFYLPGGPTSVAVHPTKPVAFVTVLGQNITSTGHVYAFDLRRPTLGRIVADFQVGFHPDSITISPDGRYAVIANEAEGHPDTPGTITIIDLTNLDEDRRAFEQLPLPIHTIQPSARDLESPPGDIEPEFVAIDPLSRFAAICCQENDAIVFIDLRTTPPQLAGSIFLPYGSQPDGLDILPASDPDDPTCLIAISEEGMFDPIIGKWRGQSVSFLRIDANHLDAPPTFLSRLDVRTALDPDQPLRRRDPEGILLRRLGQHTIALVAVERGDWVMLLDLDKPTSPQLLDKIKVGNRPEGIIAIPHDDDLIIITADEGDEDQMGPGEISFLRLSITR